jgi:hypothetical protein
VKKIEVEWSWEVANIKEEGECNGEYLYFEEFSGIIRK